MRVSFAYLSAQILDRTLLFLTMISLFADGGMESLDCLPSRVCTSFSSYFLYGSHIGNSNSRRSSSSGGSRSGNAKLTNIILILVCSCCRLLIGV